MRFKYFSRLYSTTPHLRHRTFLKIVYRPIRQFFQLVWIEFEFSEKITKEGNCCCCCILLIKFSSVTWTLTSSLSSFPLFYNIIVSIFFVSSKLEGSLPNWKQTHRVKEENSPENCVENCEKNCQQYCSLLKFLWKKRQPNANPFAPA